MMRVEITTEEESRQAGAAEAARYWWVFLVTGAFWVVFAVTVFRFDWRSVSAISILFGVMMIAAAVDELLRVAGSSAGWKVFHGVVAVIFAVIGVVAFVHPGNTFAALAAVMSFYFIVAGFFDLFLAFLMRGTEGWWLRLVTGAAQLLLGFWAAGDFGHQTILLVVWVGAAALARGVGQLVFAFALRGARPAA
jgi:uncharacterized membrane protein HdeD (DUF308 family)